MSTQDWITNALIRCVHTTTVIPTKKASYQYSLPETMQIGGDYANKAQFIFLKEEGDFRYFRDGKSGMEFKIQRELWENFWVQRLKEDKPRITYKTAIVVNNYGDRALVQTEGTNEQYIYYWNTGQMQRTHKE